MQQQPEVKLCDAAEQVVHRLLSYCAECFKDLHPAYHNAIECCACGELICVDCTRCLCERKKV